MNNFYTLQTYTKDHSAISYTPLYITNVSSAENWVIWISMKNVHTDILLVRLFVKIDSHCVR